MTTKVSRAYQQGIEIGREYGKVDAYFRYRWVPLGLLGAFAAGFVVGWFA